VPGLTRLPELGRAIHAHVLPRPLDYTPPPGSDRVAFDADLLTGPLSVRRRQPGDRFVPFGSADERRLKSFLISARIPRWERDTLALVESGGEIIWIAAVRRAAAAPVTDATRWVLELVWVPLPISSSPS
jgi:tRNA(Ile)-lysidine synthase